METRSVSRCIAIAAHGKRCQQSPFRGSPYCWHHTQSRKVWPPSRPTAGTARGARRATDATAAAAAAAAMAAEAMRDTGRQLTLRMVDALDDATLAVLVDFLESERAGAVVLAREGGRIVIGHGGTGEDAPTAEGATTG